MADQPFQFRRGGRILEDVNWAFRGEPFADRAEFSRRVHEWQRQIGGHAWRPEEVVIRAPRVRIEYLGVRDPSDEVYQDLTFDLVADDGRSFTADELLFKLHNAVVERLRESDHQYFEGLEPLPQSAPDGTLVYRMRQGS